MGLIVWCQFETIETFTVWHETLKISLGYPFPSVDSNGNECSPMNVDYTRAEIVAENDCRAFVDSEHSIGLIECEAPPRKPTPYDLA